MVNLLACCNLDYRACAGVYTKMRHVQIGFGPAQTDALLVRHACTALMHLSALQTPLSGERVALVCTRLASVILSSPLGEDGWYSAAEAALKAIYALHPTPAAVSAALLQRLVVTAFPSVAGETQLTHRSDFVLALLSCRGHQALNVVSTYPVAGQ